MVDVLVSWRAMIESGSGLQLMGNKMQLYGLLEVSLPF